MTSLVTGGRGLVEAAPTAAAARLAPLAALLATPWLLAWHAHGSIATGDWLPAAILGALILATVLASGAAVVPERTALWGLGGLAGLAAWTAISIGRSPSPSGARNEAMLAALYAVALGVPLFTLRTLRERATAIGVAVAALTSIALATAVKITVAPDASLFPGGRLDFPITYVNATAALFMLGFWPAVMLAARRGSPAAARAAALAAACALLSTGALAQSKGSAIGLAVSTVVVFAVVPQRLRLLVPTTLAAAATAVAFRTLTAPYRATSSEALDTAIRHGGIAVLVLTGAGALLGAGLAAADRRAVPGPQARRLIGVLVLSALLACLAGSGAEFFARHDHPVAFLQGKWESFKKDVPVGTQETGSTHLLSLGSNRYDFWRVALDEFRRHPLAGIG